MLRWMVDNVEMESIKVALTEKDGEECCKIVWPCTT